MQLPECGELDVVLDDHGCADFRGQQVGEESAIETGDRADETQPSAGRIDDTGRADHRELDSSVELLHSFAHRSQDAGEIGLLDGNVDARDDRAEKVGERNAREARAEVDAINVRGRTDGLEEDGIAPRLSVGPTDLAHQTCIEQRREYA